ncbi:CvpA family protein [Candidatus Thioglobus sp.]|nr:CvpA family protein [Candidatus Thioglobus sp.]
MGNFFDNFWNTISVLAWSDWLTFIILVFFVIRGFIQGLAKEIISLLFVILAIVLAWLYYDNLAISLLSDPTTSEGQSIFALSFGAIFLGIWYVKKLLYKTAEASSQIENPCELNRSFTKLIVTVLVVILSYHYMGVIAELQTMESIVTNNSFRIFVSFGIVFTALITAVIALSKLLNITIDTEKPCMMATVFEKILNILQAFDVLINARNIGGLKNNFLGAVLGLFKAGIFVLIIVLIFQSLSWVTQNHAWVETSGALRTFQNWAVDIKPFLSEHLLFIKLEPGDAVVTFIESEILEE